MDNNPLDMIDPQPKVTSKLIALTKNRLGKLERKQITLLEFDKEMAYLAILPEYGFDELHYFAPPTAPQAVKDFYAMSISRRKLAPKDFWERPEVWQYFETKQLIATRNKIIYNWLAELKERLKDDFISCDKVKKRMYEFVDN